MARSKRSKGRRKNKVHPSLSYVSHPSTDNDCSRRTSAGALPITSDGPAQVGSSACPTSPGSPAAPSFSENSEDRVQCIPGKYLTRPVSLSVGGSALHGLQQDDFDALLEGLEENELRTAMEIVKALRDPEDLSRLRRLAVTHGFVNDRIRAVVWPRLLGLTPPTAGGLALGQLPLQPSAGSRDPQPQLTLLLDPLPSRSSATSTLSHTTSLGTSPGPFASHRRKRQQQNELEKQQALRAASPPWRPPPRAAAATSPLRRPSEWNTGGATGSSVVSRGRPSKAGPGGTGDRPFPTSFPTSPTGLPGCGSGLQTHGSSSLKRRDSGGGGRGEGGEAHEWPSRNGFGGGDEEYRRASGRGTNGGGPIGHHRGSNGGEEEHLSGVAAGGRVNGPSPFAAAVGGGGSPAPEERELNEWGCSADSSRVPSTEWDLDWDWHQYLHWSRLPHRDSAVVEVDVARSLWNFTRSDEEREARRKQLKRLLNAVVAAHGGDVHYYQGLHDVASVLLMAMPDLPGPMQLPQSMSLGTSGGSAVLHAAHAACPAAAAAARTPASPGGAHLLTGVETSGPSARSSPDMASSSSGELLAFALLRRLTTTHLRDATRPSLEPVIQLLGLVPYLIRAADPPLARHMSSLGLQPFFALSWFLTWWSHGLNDLPPAVRLFDFFLASHPLMPLYLGAVAMRSQRGALLACDEMPELHSALTNLKLVHAAAAAAAMRRSGGGVMHGRLSAVSSPTGSASGPGMAAEAAGTAWGLAHLDELLRQAESLWRSRPPHTLIPPPSAPLGRAGGPLPLPLPLPNLRQLRRRRGGAVAPGGTVERSLPPPRTAATAAPDDAGSEHPPALVLSACVAHAARLEGGSKALWRVPERPPEDWPACAAGEGGRQGLVRGVLARASSVLSGRSRNALLSTALLAGVYVAAAVAIGYATLTRTVEGDSR